MKTLVTICAFLLVAVVQGTAAELSRKELISKALEAQRTFSSTRQRLDNAVLAHNKSKPDRDRRDVQLEEAFTAIQRPFRERNNSLAARISVGDRIEDFPGILALGEITRAGSVLGFQCR